MSGWARIEPTQVAKVKGVSHIGRVSRKCTEAYTLHDGLFLPHTITWVRYGMVKACGASLAPRAMVRSFG